MPHFTENGSLWINRFFNVSFHSVDPSLLRPLALPAL
uniref:Uncharacterized protein n=1 Tax=Anguilla anguilla TaxID=7936 RepID=A0A0E9T766_ANGAN